METKLKRITEKAKALPNERFTSLIHLIDEEMLKMCHKEMNGKKSTGVDLVTKEEYGENLEDNIEDLLARMKRQAYKPLPARRTYIPKVGSDKLRPLGIPAYEDKLVQSALAKVLNAVYEADFLECSFGFRPNRSAHDAIKVVHNIANKGAVQYVLDTDIKGFFDNVSHDWLMKFLGHRIADVKLLRLISRFLKAGIMDAGIKYDTPSGTPQGGVCSPILGNIYLHYVLDLWFEKKVKRRCKGQTYMVRYADDSLFLFANEDDSKAFYVALKGRLAEFKLEVTDEKTRHIKLDKRSDKPQNRDTFDFLGFTHYVDKNRKVKVKTSGVKMRASIMRCIKWIKENRTLPAAVFMKTMNRKLVGHINYYYTTYNYYMVKKFIDEVKSQIFKWLNRRSQKKSFNWNDFRKFILRYPLPKVGKARVNIYEIGAGANCL